MYSYTRETLKIPSAEGGVDLDTWLYKPTGAAPFPLVVAGHGMTVIKDAGLASFGERWASDAGYASLIFDYRFFGESGGEPRNFVSLEKQLEDYKSVLKWARQRPDLFCNDKIVVMGSALSGISVSQLLLEDTSLAGGMAHCPMLDGYAVVASMPFNPRLFFWVIVDAIKGKFGLSPIFIQAIGRPGEFSFIRTPSAYPGFVAMFAQGRTPFTEAPNLINPRVCFEIMNARPGTLLREAHAPFLVVLSQEDDMLPVSIGRSVAAGAPDVVTLVEAPGGHFGVMRGGEGYDVNITAQIDFLKGLL
ncbi:AB hydrolase superfamily protein [Pleurotus pulmonarius]|nr:hypothetical protein EYR36_000169 [Pleurotus pulmonarius]